MKVETKDGITIITADDGKAIHNVGEPVPSHTVSVRFPEGKDDPANWEDCELGEPEGEPMKYSARSILRELRELGKYEAFRQLLTSIGYDWEFLSANYLADDDADFRRLKIAVVDAGIVGSITELDTMLAKCVWSAE